MNPLMFNPFIASQNIFPNAETYQEYLRVQEQQIKIARDHFKLQMSMGRRSDLLTDLISPILPIGPRGTLTAPPSHSAHSATSPTVHYYQPHSATSSVIQPQNQTGHFIYPKSVQSNRTSTTSSNQYIPPPTPVPSQKKG